MVTPARNRMTREADSSAQARDAAPTLEIRLLGGLSIWRGGHALALPGRKAAAVLALLAARPGASISRERLTDLLWARSAPEQARASLRQALAQLRRLLDDDGGSVIDSGADGVALRADAVVVDAIECEALFDDGSVEALERAAARYGGEFLAEFGAHEVAFESWRQVEAERLRRRVLAGLGRLLQLYVDRGEVEAAVALGERLLGLDPASEETFQALIRLHLGRGALGSAMREYERCRSALDAELGVAPSPATEALRRQIRAHPPPASADPDAPPLVAVLPFANLSDDPAQGYFARGFAEDVIRALARFRPLRVIAAHSSFLAADPAAGAAEIGTRLGARYLLSGSVRRGSDSIHIGTELVDAASGHFLWSNRYDIAPGEVLAAHDEIARAVAATLATRIDDARLRQSALQPLDSLAAYDCWLRGLSALRSARPDSAAEARPLFERALALDPTFARAHSGLSLTYFNEWSCIAWERWAQNERMAFEHARRGVEVDDGDPVTHFILGRIFLYRREFERAERHLGRAELLNPNDADILAQLAVSDVCLGCPQRGVERIELAMRLNPFHDDWYFAFAAMPYLFVGEFAAAIEFGLKAPNVATDVHAQIAVGLAHLGRVDEARRHLDAFLAIYRRNINAGRPHAADEPARWLVHVNPLRRAQDVAFLLDGLARAGLAVPPDLRPA